MGDAMSYAGEIFRPGSRDIRRMRMILRNVPVYPEEIDTSRLGKLSGLNRTTVRSAMYSMTDEVLIAERNCISKKTGRPATLYCFPTLQAKSNAMRVVGMA